MDTDPYLCLVHSVSPHAYQRLYPLLLQVRAQSVLKQAKDANQQEFIIMICNNNVRVVLDIQIRVQSVPGRYLNKYSIGPNIR